VTLTVETSVGKKYAVYLPKAVVKALNLKEGGKILLRVSGTSLVLESVQDPLQLALSSKKYASVDPEEIEKTSIREQAKTVKNPS
jgi:AbrB family looped-hinge helix DNA binding protein